MSNARRVLCVVLVMLLVTSIAVIIALILYRAKDWVESWQIIHQVYPIDTLRINLHEGDILLKPITKFLSTEFPMFGKSFFHFGMMAKEPGMMYQRGIDKFEYCTFEKFMDNEPYFFLMRFPNKYYRPMKETMKIIRHWLKKDANNVKKFNNYNLWHDNCETKIILARLKDEYQPEMCSFQLEWLSKFRPFMSDFKYVDRQAHYLIKFPNPYHKKNVL